MNAHIQTYIGALALAILGVLACMLTFHAVPQENRELLSMIVGAIAGALTMGGAGAAVKALAKPPGPESA